MSKTDTTISINGGPEVPIDLALAAVNHIKGKRQEAAPFGVEKVDDIAKHFTDEAREVLVERAGQAAVNMIYSKFLEVYRQLGNDADENDGLGSVDLTLKMRFEFASGVFSIDGLGIKWTRKIGAEDKDFDRIEYNPNQPTLPGVEVN